MKRQLPQWAVTQPNNGACTWFDTEEEAKAWLATLARFAANAATPALREHYSRPRRIVTRAEGLALNRANLK